ncbi:hypothetical protein AKJ39_03710 [candidate division MSBL1 archaeon SCGC-AAA259J03]|uniref:Anion transporter n=4 Tax=candidate division MSBL1 TaxID=215777 RepID=A0A656YY96_9EURY|nr:hypothetical protein AKJ39_03710 [candidate division MSBL1 archaeon SCGC-AAA259J03]
MSDENRSENDEGLKELSEVELRRRMLFFAVSVVVLVVVSVIPAPDGLSLRGQRALGILAFVAVLWVTETFPLGLTALFGAMLLPVLGVLPPADSFAGFGSTALFFLIGALSFGIAMQKTNLHKRIALRFIGRVGKSSSRLILSICLLGGILSWTMPEHAVAALLLPILIGIVEAGGIDYRQNFGIALFLALTYGTSVGSMGTLLGGARNVLAIGIMENFSNISLSFVDWAVAGIPIAVVLMFVTFFTLRIVYPWEEIDAGKIRSELREEVEEIGPMSRDEKKAGLIFASAFVLWSIFATTVGLATIAIGGLVALVITRTITWRDIEQEMPWGIIFLYGGAVTLSQALRSAGSVEFLANGLMGFIGQKPLLIVAIFLVTVVYLSQVMSNTAATAIILPITISSLIEFGYPAQLGGYLIAMGAAMAFMLPIATPSAAMAYTSGYIEVRDLIKAGAILNVLGIITFLTFGLGWWKLLGIW